MSDYKIEKMEPDATAVDKGNRDWGDFSDLLGDNKSLTMIKVEKLKAPDDLEDMEGMDDDMQDGTRVDISNLMHKLMKGGKHGLWD